jgi:hypothetical protein
VEATNDSRGKRKQDRLHDWPEEQTLLGMDSEENVGSVVTQTTAASAALQRQEAHRTAEQQRAAAIAAATTNMPVPADRPAPDARGQIDVGPQRCVATNKRTHKQCEEQTRHGCHCNTHRAQLDGTRIRASSVPGAGKGLWAATRDFRPGDTIARYTGDLVRTKSSSASRYVLQLSVAVSIDAARTNTADARMVK